MKKYNEKSLNSISSSKNHQNKFTKSNLPKNIVTHNPSKSSLSPQKRCVISSSKKEEMINIKKNECFNVKVNSFFPQIEELKTQSLDLSKTVFNNEEIPIRLSANFEKNQNIDPIKYFNDEVESFDDDEKEEEYIYNNKIKIIKLMDKGSQGKIFLGQIEDLKIPVAIKRYNVENFEQIIVENIVRETEIVKNLDHENIIKYYALECNLIDKNNGNIDIIMEYLDGCNLKHYIKTHSPLSLIIIKNITKKILKGLNFLHENNIIHRDLKPENIIISHNCEKLKITDFGISTKVVGNESFLNRTLVGTPWYMAPEIILSKPYGYEVDIWSLGCIIYEMVSGEKPFSDTNQINAMVKVTQFNTPLQYGNEKIKDIFYDKSNRDLLDFVENCWRTNNTFRPSAKELLQHKFLNI